MLQTTRGSSHQGVILRLLPEEGSAGTIRNKHYECIMQKEPFTYKSEQTEAAA
jgi:hypothetical protein